MRWIDSTPFVSRSMKGEAPGLRTTPHCLGVGRVLKNCHSSAWLASLGTLPTLQEKV